MSEKNLVICDSEVRYAYGLGDYVSERNELDVKVFVCTDLNNVRRFQKKREIHMLILGENEWKQDREGITAEQVFVLSSQLELELQENETEIYRFQSADAIFLNVFETYSEKTNQDVLKHMRKKKQKIVAVYSPIHRIGKTTFALSLGKEFAKNGRTLYVNLENFAGFGGTFKSDEGRNLGTLIYYMKQEKGNAALRMSMMADKIEELNYIPPMEMYTDLQGISLEEWQMFLGQILQSGIYGTVILDLGEGVQHLMGILQMCDKIYMPILEDVISTRKLEQCDENLRRLKITGLQQKICRFTAMEDMEEQAKKMIREEQ